MEVRKAGHCKDKAVRDRDYTEQQPVGKQPEQRESSVSENGGVGGSPDKRSEKTGFVTFMVTWNYPCGKNTKADWLEA